MKKIVFVICLLVTLSFCGCNKAEEPAVIIENSVEVISKDWKVDLENHWCVDKEEKIVDLEKHDWKEEQCVICGAKKSENSGLIYISLYNNLSHCKYSAGYIEKELYHELFYDYKSDTAGNEYVAVVIEKYPDGGYYETECDETGKMVKTSVFSGDGKCLESSWYEHEYDKNGNVISSKYFYDSFEDQEEQRVMNESKYALGDNGEWYLSVYK